MNKPNATMPIFDRSTVIGLLTNAVRVESYRFACRLAEAWLELYAGDLVVETLYAQALLKQDKVADAIPVIKKIVFTDPEYLPAQRLLAYSSNLSQYKSVATAQQCILALGGRVPDPNPSLNWSKALIEAQSAQQQELTELAETHYQAALAAYPDSPLPAVLHFKFIAGTRELTDLMAAGEEYTHRWPDTLACLLIYADALNQAGRDDEAIELLHHAVSLDIGGQVAVRLWGAQHPYLELWPANPAIQPGFPVPADVATAVGWNQLPSAVDLQSPAGSKTVRNSRKRRLEKSSSERALSKQAVHSAKRELEELAVRIQNPVLGSADARYPAYVLITSKNGLEAQYGADSLRTILQTIELVERSTKQIKGWNAYTLYVDDPLCADAFDLPPALAHDPWSIKNFIHDLDRALAAKGERIGALLIVGGEKVIPFHLLPNPIDDFDAHVPSDNPYACSDENYFIPQWPIGRLPGSTGSDPQALLNQLKAVIKAREVQLTPERRQSWLVRLFNLLLDVFLGSSIYPNFGYTAEIWRRASHAVYRPIGKPQHLKISPPITATRINGSASQGTPLAYFNLHGLEDAAEWYGQRDPVEGTLGPDYPVALRPQDILNHGSAPKIVFSEACFGANVVDKVVEDAICLKFLDSGTKAVIGSTCTSYGSIATPLIAADLLGKAFWSYTQEGFPAGEALRRAKIHLAREMNKRQGYLDGEDQKTLISFVLYGDPLATVASTLVSTQPKNLFQPAFNPGKIKTVCDKVNLMEKSQVPEDVIAQVKGVVEHHLPGMEGASLTFAQEHTQCKGHECPTHHLGGKTNPKSTPSRKVVTLSKQFVREDHTHAQHARITFNAEGKVTKLAVSR